MGQRVLAVALGGEDCAAGFARRLAKSGMQSDLLLAGPHPVPAGSWGTVWRLPSEVPAAVLPALEQLNTSELFDAILFDESAAAREVAGRLAARRDLPVAASVLSAKADEDGLAVARIVDRGARTANLLLKREPALLIPHPEASEASGTKAPVIGREVDLPVTEPPRAIELLKETRLLPDQMDVTEADVVVAGGRGMGGPAGFEMLEELAALLGGTVGASRVAVDAGWIPYARQIGLTGKSVAPRLYIACGISGALHHTLGMRYSSTIVAINSDAKAPIFGMANVVVVADV
ncbi:MAG: electron transfer flavoprotein subunit alpha/FixB family protein, partial [Dehalococcoidia bacterium]